MYSRDCIAQEFYIEEHAVLYALLAKYAKELYGQAGWDASIQGTMLYGRERGGRMAQRALADREPLTPNNYLLYGEWADHLNWSASRVVSLAPTYHTQSTRCGWCDSWQRHNLMEYGQLYCTYIDLNLVKGFNLKNDLKLDKILSHGDDCCDFQWLGASFNSPEEIEAFGKKKAELAPRVLKDFLYHTAHVYSAMVRTYDRELSHEASENIAAAALDEFGRIYGESKREAVLIESQLDFNQI